MTTGLVSTLTFLVGLLIGNWLAIGRDKRKEFNELSVPIREWLLRIKNSPDPFTRRPSSQEIDRFVICLYWWQRKAFRHHLECYNQAHNTARVRDRATGEVSYGDTSAIKYELEAMFTYTNRR